MELNDYLTITAIILGPVLAVQIEKLLERYRSKKDRKEAIFKTLMATRGTVLSHAHVEALNRIDLEFSGDKSYKKVIDTWKEYFDNLHQQVTDEQLSVWTARNEELLANLLFEMGKALKYDFDKVLIKRNVYSPIGHSNTEREQQDLRKRMLEIVNGARSIPMTLIQDTETIENQKKLQDVMLKYYESNTEE